MVTKTPDYVLKKIQDFVRNAFIERFSGELVLHDIVILAHEDPFGDQRVHMYVVYDGDPNRMDMHWAGRLISRVIDYMPEEELPDMPLKDIIHKSEWSRYYRYNVEPWTQKTS